MIVKARYKMHGAVKIYFLVIISFGIFGKLSEGLNHDVTCLFLKTHLTDRGSFTEFNLFVGSFLNVLIDESPDIIILGVSLKIGF